MACWVFVLLLQSLLFGVGGITALVLGGEGAVVAALVAGVLGIQPLLAQRADGMPLFFPFGLEVTLPALLLPHALIGIAEAGLTLMVWRYAKARKWPVC